MQTGRSRESKRTARRREVRYAIQMQITNKASSLTSPAPENFSSTNEERLESDKAIIPHIDEYFRAISEHRSAYFGLIKLSHYNLNELYPFPITLHPWKKHREETRVINVFENAKVTLLQYAVYMEQDSIVLALVRAGATPLAEDVKLSKVSCLMLHQRIAVLLHGLPHAYVVWLVCHLTTMLSTLDSTKQSSGSCMSPIHSITSTAVECDVMDQSEAHRVGRWPSCGHVVCGECAWTHVVSTGGIFTCPCCLTRQPDDQPAEFESTFEDLATLQQQSFARFQALPLHGTNQRNPDKTKFHRLSLIQYAHKMPGHTQAKRMEKFHDAVNQNNYERVRFLLELGVNINYQDEYGHSALFLATWRQFDSIARLIRSWGADSSLADNMGITCDQLISTESLHRVHINIERMQFTQLIPEETLHPGAGSFYIDNAFTEEFLSKLETACANAPIVPPEKQKLKQTSVICSQRRYICDTMKWITATIEQSLRYLPHRRTCGIDAATTTYVYSHMRFLQYTHAGSYLAPHVDLSRTDINGLTSTHTFILYLDSCDYGGETSLLTRIPSTKATGDRSTEYAVRVCNVPEEFVIHAVQPQRGRLLVFPHKCPHEGRVVIDVPKTILRGEVLFK